VLGLALFLLFTAVPALETWLLIEAGRVIGGWETVGWLLLMGVLGAWLGKRAGFRVWAEIQGDLAAGRSPADHLWEAALVLVGSVLLITPGFLSDVVGALLFVPPVRRALVPPLKRWVLARVTVHGVSVGEPAPGPAAPPRRATGRFDHPTA
jgi:UPF0716 protein FxsA